MLFVVAYPVPGVSIRWSWMTCVAAPYGSRGSAFDDTAGDDLRPAVERLEHPLGPLRHGLAVVVEAEHDVVGLALCTPVLRALAMPPCGTRMSRAPACAHSSSTSLACLSPS